ncbi:MAG: glycosyltransferase [Ignavibacteria bacterium]|nr:glycosyltransferase [Ignavibacteria bacterium]
MKNKVLVIAYYFPPMGLSGVQRIAKFVKYLPKFNWQPTVLTIAPKIYYAHDQTLLDELTQQDIRIIRTDAFDVSQPFRIGIKNKFPNEFYRSIMNKLSQLFFIPDNKIGWRKKAVKSACKILESESFDLIFATAPPFTALQVGMDLKSKFKIPLVVDYRDAWVDNQYSFYWTPFHRSLNKLMEREVLKKSNKIIAYNRQLKEHILQVHQFLNFEDVVIIPHGYDPEDFQIKFESTKTKNKMRITYTGSFYDKITPKYLILAVKELFYEKPDLSNRLEFCFVGHFRKHNEKLIKKFNLTNAFNLVGYLEHRESVKYLLDSDVLWLTLGEMKNVKTIATSKLFEYFGAEKPILASVPDGAITSLLREYEAYLITPPHDIRAIKSAIVKFFEMYEKKQLPKPNQDFVKRFDRLSLTNQLAKEFHEVVMELV